MVKIKVTYNAKPKRTEELDVVNFGDLVTQIYKIFNIEDGKLNFMKPRLKVNLPKYRIKIPLRNK